ncbi:hypothetical protein MKX01_014715 [Papaver californicum]|nr:hypothetical protein MKX01_014715 [Papaver californicum]
MDQSFMRVLFTAFIFVLIMISAAPPNANADPSWGSVPEDADGKWEENDG